MKLYSTKDKSSLVSLSTAVLKGLPDDNGLYMPEHIPQLPKDFLGNLKDYSFQEIAFIVCSAIFNGIIPEEDLKKIVYEAIDLMKATLTLIEELNPKGWVLENPRGMLRKATPSNSIQKTTKLNYSFLPIFNIHWVNH